MKTKTKLVLLALAVLFIGLVAWKFIASSSSGNVRRQPVVLVQVEQPRREKILYKLSYSADVVPVQQANIYSKINGNLERVFVDLGAHVQEDQLLALIDTVELSQLAQQASATYENTRVNYQRTKELAEQNLIAKQELDNADAAMKVAKANYEAATTRLNYAQITAPFSGYITKRYLDPGVNVKSNDLAIFTLMDFDMMKIMVNVLEKDIPLVTKGKKGIIKVDAYPGMEFYGTVTRLSEAVDLSTRTMAVEIDVANKDHLLKPGMYANVTLLVDEHENALTVPTQAIMKDDNGQFVFTTLNNIARRRPITAGVEQKSHTEILSGLQDRDTVVITGQQFLKDSVRVSIQ